MRDSTEFYPLSVGLTDANGQYKKQRAKFFWAKLFVGKSLQSSLFPDEIVPLNPFMSAH